MDPTTVLHKVVHGDSIENARPTKRVNRISSCMPQPSIYVTSIEPTGISCQLLLFDFRPVPAKSNEAPNTH